MSKFVVLFLMLTSINCFGAEPAYNYLGSCRYYHSLASEMSCPKNQYLIQFGEYYCRKFDRHRHEFSKLGRIMLKRIKRCLQTSLESTENLSCSNVKAVALQSHVECYRKAHFCKMPLSDKNKLGWIVKGAILDREYRATMLKILNSCNDGLRLGEFK